ncbi:site-2 protease family protein [Nitrospina watsonii]|uniref:Site-2 protease family protein n=1 Tax=Nitrospina watsonii TaxID=1323948 RepID=A0ABM9HDN8_9BACT|nr:site-2 protease family protein [Nitrospina watsonii]CAI2718194.1 Site-2 protease family protein [Nitrospina watsonii]
MDFKPDDRDRPQELDPWLQEDAPEPPPRFIINFRTVTIFVLLFVATVFTTTLVGGVWYALGLLSILGVHEFGHYLACRRNNVDATLPNFLPAPPLFIVGTFGAFIAIKEPIPDKRALMEIGASGPIAGFLMALVVMGVGLEMSVVSHIAPPPALGFNYGNSLILYFLSKLVLGVSPFSNELTIYLHPLALAGWFGMFFTALNLIPIGQLDGGHIIYALFQKQQPALAWIFFLALFPLGMYWTGWFVWAAMVLVIGVKHPPVIDESIALTPFHKKVGYASIFIFIVTFVPVPIDLIQ